MNSRIYVKDKKSGKIEKIDMKGRGINRWELEEKFNKDGKKFLFWLNIEKRWDSTSIKKVEQGETQKLMPLGELREREDRISRKII